MVKSPSKFLSRSFLKSLTENNFQTERGAEYCEAEVRALLIEKQERFAHLEYNRELKEEDKRARESDFMTQVLTHQSRIIPALKLRDLIIDCQRLTPSEQFKANTIFSLPGKKSNVEVETQQARQQMVARETAPPRTRGKKLKSIKGYRATRRKAYSKKSLEKAVNQNAKAIKIIADMRVK